MTNKDLADGLKAIATKDLRFKTAREADARLCELRQKLGIAPSNFTYNVRRANQDIVKLEALLAQKGLAFPPAALKAAEAIPAVVPTKAPLVPSDEGQHTAAADWMKLSDTDRVSFCRGGGELVTTEFAKLSPAHRMDFMRAGGKVIDGPALTAAVDHGGATVISRQHFEGMTPAIRMAYIQNGGQISE